MKSDEGDGIDLRFLQSRIENLKNGKFTLAVAGEVKAGKSTFINALLGTELLPADVLQATSAVVEICKAERVPYQIRRALPPLPKTLSAFSGGTEATSA